MATIEIGGKTLTVQVKDGIQYVEGITVEQFIDKLIKEGDTKTLKDAMWLGMQIQTIKTTGRPMKNINP